MSIPYPIKVDDIPLKTSSYAKYVISQIVLANKQTDCASLEWKRTYQSKTIQWQNGKKSGADQELITDRFPTSREVLGHGSPGIFLDFNSPKSPFLGF